MARVNKAKDKGVHNYLLRQEQRTVQAGKDRKALKPVAAQKTVDVKMEKNKRETRREKIARKKQETKKRKAPGASSAMDVDDAGSRLRVKKTTGIHK